MQIVRTLAKYPTAVAGTVVLTAATRDPEPDVRQAACLVLGARGGAEAVTTLSHVLLGDVNLDVRHTAAIALGRTHDLAAAVALGNVLQDPDPAMQLLAVESLEKVTGKHLGNDVNRWREYVQRELPGTSAQSAVAGRPVPPPH